MQRQCTLCSEWKEPIEFAIFRRSKDGNTAYYNRLCRSCCKVVYQQRKHLRKAPKEPAPCEICETVTKLHADHCWKSGVRRADLCRKCNCALGMLGEEEGLIKALAYLRKWNACTMSSERLPQQRCDSPCSERACLLVA